MANIKYAILTKKQKGRLLEDYIGFDMKAGDICKKYNIRPATFQSIVDEYWGNGIPVFMNIDVSNNKKRVKK